MMSAISKISALVAAFTLLHGFTALAAAPVSNVRHYRISDDTVIIYYDLTGEKPSRVSVEVSLDGGKEFTVRPRALSGDVGEGVSPGASRRIIWNFGKDGVELPGNAVIRVVAAEAPDGTAPPGYGEKKRVAAYRIHEPVVFDGVLSEAFWKTAEPATGFTQREMREGEPATERTEVRIVYDENNLYIGVMCFDSEPAAIIHNEMRRDVEPAGDDNFTLVLDTYGGFRHGYFFQINPNGARYDGFFYGTELTNENWDGVWDARSRITERGWSAEIMIPFKTLRFPDTGGRAWGINFRRLIRRKSEEVLWCSWRRDDGLFQLSRAGLLVGLEGVEKGRKIDFIPYVLGGAERRGNTDDTDFKYGFDVRYPITSGLTLNVTTHTDFAQVETDKERINLTRFSLFYPEKRDFFLEGAEIFDFDAGYFEKVYHSRRIGIGPERGQIPILGGVNLAGRAGPYSIGALNIQTDRKGATPRTNYSVVRIKRDVLERSRIGFIATNLHDANGHTNRVLGADFFYQTNRLMGDKNFGLRGDLSASFTDGRGSKNLFGRAFIDYPNDFIDSFVELYHVGGNFNPEVGFITRRGIRRVNGKFRVFPRPGIPFVNKLIFMPFGLNYISDMGGRMLERNVMFWPFGILTTTDDMVKLTVNYFYDYVDRDFTVFGGHVIPADTYSWKTYGVEFESNKSRPLSISLLARKGDFYTGTRDVLNPGLTVKLNRYVAASTEVLYNDITLGDEHLITREYGGRLHLNLSTKLTSTTFIQYNNETKEVNMNFRLHFIPNMGSDLYLVYNHLWDESRDYATLYRTAIVKLDYLARF